MSDLEKLNLIIIHASKKGFDFCKWKYENTDLSLMGMLEGNVKQLLKSSYWKLLLLDKEFAKCFFGEESSTDFCWQYHLQELVLEDDLIDYYFKFLEKK